MSDVVFLFFLLSSLPILTVSLQCYTCDTPITVNYTVTGKRIPSFTNCQLINATQCTMSVIWLQAPAQTVITLSYRSVPLTNDTLPDYVIVMALLELSPDEKTPLIAHSVQFACISWEQCNSEMSLRSILHSLVIEDNFVQEFFPLIQVVQPFTNKSAAACYGYTNTTDDCSQTSLDTCQRCQISINTRSSSSKEICATCPKDFLGENWVLRESVFILDNRTRLIDHVQLKCQLPGCNSISSGNGIYRASTITFDFREFFKNLFNNTRS